MERPIFQLERVSLFFYASYELLHRHDQQRKYILFYFFAEKQNCLYFLFLSIFLHIFNLDAFFGFSFGLLLLFSLQSSFLFLSFLSLSQFSSFSLFFLCRSFPLSLFSFFVAVFLFLCFLICCYFSVFSLLS